MSTPAALFCPVGRRPVVVLGLGLLGRNIARALQTEAKPIWLSVGAASPWSKPDALADQLLSQLEALGLSQVDLVWCAGKAGMLSLPEALQKEYDLFATVCARFAERLTDGFSVRLLSSAGGAHQGSSRVTSLAQVTPTSPYGEWKLRQEQFLKDNIGQWQVFRVSSVYGVPETGVRKGFLATLIHNARLGLPTQIYADPLTRRDYVLADDLAAHLRDCLQVEADCGTHLLASGRAVNVLSLVQAVEKATGRRALTHYSAAQQNERDIVFSKTLLPPRLRTTPLEEGIRLILARSRGGLSPSLALSGV